MSAWSLTKKSNYPGKGLVGAFSFTIGNKGYVGGGSNNSKSKKDFWEFDPIGNGGVGLWTEKASFPGKSRIYAAAFGIGESINKGYVGAGMNIFDENNFPILNDFWEYDPALDKWESKGVIPGSTKRSAPSSFSIKDKGYVGLGFDGANYLNDFWEYDPSSNTWKTKDIFPGEARAVAVAFSINSRGYVGPGDGVSRNIVDFYEFNPAAVKNWRQKASLPIVAAVYVPPASSTLPWLTGAVGFGINHKCYIGTGRRDLHGELTSVISNFWEFSPQGNGLGVWNEIDPLYLGYTPRSGAVGFAINNRGFVGLGENFDENGIYFDFFEYS